MTAERRRGIAITGMNATDNPAPGLAVVRCLRHPGAGPYRLIGLGYDPLDSGFYTGLLDGGGVLPYPSAGREALLGALRTFKSEVGFDVVLPTLDSELRALIALEPTLRHEGIAMCVPSLEALDRASKPQLPKLRTAGIRVPDSEPITSPDAIGRLVSHLGLPLVVKGLYYGAVVVSSEADAVAAFRHFEATWGLPVVIQEFIAGDEYNVCALGDGTGQLIGAVAMRKLVVTDKGKGWAGVTVANPHLTRLAERLVGALQWRGPLEIEVIAEGSSLDTVTVIEINPRFPAWVYLTAAAGLNLPDACVRLALGETVAPAGPADAGRLFVRVSMDQVASLETFAQLSSTGRLPTI